MLTREQLEAFRKAPWTSAPEVEEFASQVSDPSRDDVVRLLGVLTDKASSADAPRQRQRAAAFLAIAQRVRERELFSAYVDAMKGADRTARATLATLLPQVNDPSRHGDLCELLSSSDEDLRGAAARVLRAVGGRAVVERLEEMAGAPSFEGRRQAVDLLVALGGHRSIPGLAAALRAGRPLERRHCLRYLGDANLMRSDLPAATRAIVPAFEDPNEAVLQQAISAYCNVCTEDQFYERIYRFLSHESPNVVRAGVMGLQRFSSPRTILTLERKLRAGPNNVRFAVLDTLEAIGTNDILPPLVEALSHKQLVVRRRASEIMARLGRSGRLNLHRTIIWLLRSGDVDLKRTAADLARSVPDPEAELWPKLIAFLRDDDWWVRERVVDALIELAGPGLSPFLATYLKDPHDVIRRFAIGVFLRLEDPKTLGLLLRTAAEDDDWWVRERAIEAAAALRDERAVPYVVDIMAASPDMAPACLKALSDLEVRSAAPQVAAQLASPHPDVRLMALSCLAKLDDSGQAGAIQALADDPSPEVRAAAGDLLHRWEMSVRAPQLDSEAGLSTLDGLLAACAEQGADDLLIAADRPAYIKKLGHVAELTDRPLSASEVEGLIAPRLSSDQLQAVRAGRDADFSYEVEGRDLRFRANVFRQFVGLSAVFRIIKSEIPDLAELGLPEIVTTFADYRNGLVLVGGPTGSGKSTTLAAIIDRINRLSPRHVISMEDPIEVRHPSKRSLVNQREIGTHTRTAHSALRSTLRQDPDVILVGEMRDFPTISFAVTAAETGHLVFGTLHTVSADTTVDRIINAFPHAQAGQVRSMLSDSLRAVLCQYLIPKADAQGRVLAVEIMLSSEAIANLIRKGKTHQIPSMITTSREHGMQLMDVELRRLFDAGAISAEDAYMRAASKKDFEALLQRGPGSEPEDLPEASAKPPQPATEAAAARAES
jgi:twitching motility protein PilT